jgi:two-component system CheB/CheR fusion protein
MTKKKQTKSPQRHSAVEEIQQKSQTDGVEEPKSAPLRQAGPSFPIVGIGASAGGLAAFEAFFKALPADFQPGMAFVLVQHLSPNHKSILADLIREFSNLLKKNLYPAAKSVWS